MFVFFDLDRTLLDFETAETCGIKKIYDTYSSEIIMPWIQFLSEWKKWAQIFFDKYSAKQMSFTEQRNARIEKIFELNGHPNMEKDEQQKRFDLYYSTYEENLKLYEDAIPFLIKLKENNIKLGLITNGDSKNQRKKIERAGLTYFFDPIIISDEVGFSKPDLHIFNIALQKANATSSESWYIGDSLRHDIEPAKELGMNTVYVNRTLKDISIEENEQINISVDSFASLMNLIKNKEKILYN